MIVVVEWDFDETWIYWDSDFGFTGILQNHITHCYPIQL
jgi:hypothetical protein